MKQLEAMKEQLTSIVQGQLANVQNVDAKELGEVIDMIKDLDEAIYYCSVVKAMEEEKEERKKMPQREFYTEYEPYDKIHPYEYYREKDRRGGSMYYGTRPFYYDMTPMYYGGNGNSGSTGGSRGGSSNSGGNNGSSYYTEGDYPIPMHDYREGRSPMSRKMYMESKELHKDKNTQMKELEKYMKELSMDITELIEEASPEERMVLKQKLTALAEKVK